jgi:RNA polymerase sigma-70 factor (ECF subfamily)
VCRAIGKFQYDRQRGRFRNWLGAMTAHEITRHQRRSQRPGQGFGNGCGDQIAALSSAPLDPAWVEEFNSYVYQRALARVRPTFEEPVWRAFEMTWLQDMSAKEAAAAIGKPTAWIYKARYKVIERLRQELDFLTSDAAPFQLPS